MAGSLNVDLLVPDETELALLGGLETLFERDVKNNCRNIGRGYEICTFAKRKRYSCGEVKVVETTVACDKSA